MGGLGTSLAPCGGHPSDDGMVRSFTFLGTGTSAGVPMLGCDCAVCRRPIPHNHRYRCCGLIRTPDRQHPDRHAAGVAAANCSATAIRSSTPSCTRTTTPTTCSASTTCGPFRACIGGPVPVYCTDDVEAVIRPTFPYVFDSNRGRDAGRASCRRLAFHRIKPSESFTRARPAGRCRSR